MMGQLVKRIDNPGTHGDVENIGDGQRKWIPAFAREPGMIENAKMVRRRFCGSNFWKRETHTKFCLWQMSDVLQLDYFTCASLLVEAKEDFDTNEHKPIIRAIHAYYSSLEAILRAIFFLLRLRRDSVRHLCFCCYYFST